MQQKPEMKERKVEFRKSARLSLPMAMSLVVLFVAYSSPDAIAGECSSPRPEWLFCDDFEIGTFNRWSDVATTTDVKIVDPSTMSQIFNAPPRRSEHSIAEFHYVIDPALAAHQDSNRFLGWNLPTPTDHLFVRGYVLIPKNTALFGTTNSIQRKLIYFKSNNWISPSSGFGFMLTSDVETPSANYVTLRLGYGGVGGATSSLWNLGRIYAGRWTAIQVEILLNSPNQANGIFRVWIDNVLVHENLNIDYRSPFGNDPSYQIGRVEVGRQADRLNGDAVDEYRYWDNIVVSTSYVTSLSIPTNIQ